MPTQTIVAELSVIHPQAIFYAIPLLFGAVVALAICFLALQRYHEPGAKSFMIAMASVSVWSFAYAFEIMHSDLAGKMIWHKIIYTMSSAVPAFWLLFVWQQEHHSLWRARIVPILLMIEPVIYTILTWTNESHKLLWVTIDVTHTDALPQLVLNRGIGFYVHTGITYVLVLVSVIYFLRLLRRESSTLSYLQILLLISGIMLSVLANAIHLLNLNPLPINLTPFALLTMGAVVGWFAFRFDLWDILPAAHDAVFFNTDDGVIVLNLRNAIIDLNPAAYELLDLPDRIMLGWPIDAVLPTREQGYQQLQRLLTAPLSPGPLTVEIVLAKPLPCYIDVVISQLRDRRERITGRILTLRDVTKRREMELALQAERALLTQRVEERTRALSKANAELGHAVRLKDEFLANMSHELRTPLNTILGLAEALQEEIYGDLAVRQARALTNIQESGRHLLSLINDVLDVSKVEAGKLTLEPGPVAVDSLCQSSVNFVTQVALQKRLTIKVVVDPQVKLIFGDERRLKQILVNLLSNAVKFTPTGGTIGLDVLGMPEQDMVQFVVWDTGIGIAMDDMPRLFKPFVQLDSRLTRQHEGTGLGLTLVHRMVDLHGGSIAVTSDVGQGSRFTVSLPWRIRSFAQVPQLAKSAAAVPHLLAEDPTELTHADGQRTPIPGQWPSAQIRILLVEDNETNIGTFCDYLAAKGYFVAVARSGAEALERLAEVAPDLILMDVQMPGMDGLEVTRRIRAGQIFTAVPIVALTALAMPGDRERCLTAGMNDYLSKPVSLGHLLDVIETHLPLLHLHPAQQWKRTVSTTDHVTVVELPLTDAH